MTELVQQEMPTKKEDLSVQLAVEQMQFHLDALKKALPSVKKIDDLSSSVFQEVSKKVADFALSLQTSKMDPEYLEAFFKHPYFLVAVPKKQETWNLHIPRFIDMQIGYLQQQTESWNIFLVNRYAEWLGGIPESLKKELGLKTPLELKLEGDILFGSGEAQKEAWKRYGPLLKSQDKEGIRVDPKRAFELIAALVKDGILPFSVRPIPSEDLVENTVDFELREYQLEAWKVFKMYSNAGIYWPPSGGKTFITLYAMAHLKPPFLIAVPSLALKEQWEERIALHLPFLRNETDYVVGTYYHVIKRCMDREWSLFAIDEVQHLPADNFAKMAMIRRQRTLGLSATPQREDEREPYIFALTGKPIGIAWDSLKKLGVIKSPTVHVWILKNQDSRLKKLSELLQEKEKTLIFCDSIELGKMIAARHEIPFVSGETKNERLKTIQESETVVVSRVGDEGISLPDISRVIEVSWLFGSRRQELQRFGRLLHSTGKSSELEHHVLMTIQEYSSDKKRLFSVMDKGFKIVLHQDETSEKVIQKEEQSRERLAPLPKARFKPSRVAPPGVEKQQETSDVDAIYQKVGLPRAPKFRASMSKGQQKAFDYFIQNDGSFFPLEKLAILLEYKSAKSMTDTIDFGEMVRNRWIERKKIEGNRVAYGTEMRAKVQ